MSRIDRTAIQSRPRTRWYTGAPLVLLFLASSAAAQTTTSTIEGTVTDASRAVVPGAEVRVSGTTLVTERRTTTDANGVYRVTALPAGNYTLTVVAKGFTTRTAELELTLNRVLTFDISLPVEAVQELSR